MGVKMIKQYRKKPVVIEAIQWNGNNHIEVAEFMFGANVYINVHKGYVEIETLEGKMFAEVNDYIIKGVKGEFYPCKPDIFEQTYEEVL